MHQKLETRRAEIVPQRISEGKGFLDKKALLRTIPGTPAKSPKRSTRESHRPRVLSINPVRRAICKAWHFGKYFAYKHASKLYRSGELTTIFPEGMYPPSRQCCLSP